MPIGRVTIANQQRNFGGWAPAGEFSDEKAAADKERQLKKDGLKVEIDRIEGKFFVWQRQIVKTIS